MWGFWGGGGGRDILSGEWCRPAATARATILVPCHVVNSSRPGQNGRPFADDIFICSFMNEKFSILIKISLKFNSRVLIDNNPALVEIMAWSHYLNQCWLSSPMHICGTRGRWVVSLQLTFRDRGYWTSFLDSLISSILQYYWNIVDLLHSTIILDRCH